MKRRNFIATSVLAGAAPLAAASAFAAPQAQQYLELRRYHALPGPGQGRLVDYLRDAAVPAWNRAGIRPVGVFNVLFGPTNPTIYVLLPHPTLDSFATTAARVAADVEYQSAGADFLNASLAEPAFVRMESSLMRAFTHMPEVEVPATTTGNRPRIFELRIYESHSEPAAVRKIEMFNEGGEIAIFRKTGLTPVFFGETIVGPQMPNLTYMLTFADFDERARAWDTFIGDPDWIAIRDDPHYRDTVSNISDFILRPLAFSQI